MAVLDQPKISSKADEIKKENGSDTRTSSEAPPTYNEQAEEVFVPEIPPLDGREAGPAQTTTVTRDHCVGHLKLLSTLADLRQLISQDDGLFGIHDSQADQFIDPQERYRALARIREKRWAVYTTRAVDRYESWWTSCIPAYGTPPTTQDLAAPAYPLITRPQAYQNWVQDKLPPLDILMVWHAHMLNPRAYLEDCLRGAKMHLWNSSFPWQLIDKCIDNKSFDYSPGPAAEASFEKLTGRPWNNLTEGPAKTLDCVRCGTPVIVPWTRGDLSTSLDMGYEMASGYADKSFLAACEKCSFAHNHGTLRLARFRQDLDALFNDDQPLPGTFYNLYGIPVGDVDHWFPNRLAQASQQQLLRATDPRLGDGMDDMVSLRSLLESLIQDHRIVAQATPLRRTTLNKKQRIAFRRMMAHYWENSSRFGLDLVGAVTRQGTFVDKMDNLDWIHSPALSSTMDRLIAKYAVFFRIMAENPQHMAVPTLDVDLAWHTHQLSPSRYFEYSTATTKIMFVDHDDKVDEIKLSDGFEWTSKQYKKLTDGGVYSECTCWYCEATRESTLFKPLPFHTSSTMRARTAAENLHNDPNISPDPERNPHISAHNAVRVQGLPTAASQTAWKQMRLRTNYEKAYRRAQKRRQKEVGRAARDNRNRGAAAASPYDAYMYYPMVWGYPMYGPYYAPYMCDPAINGDAYACNPACMNMGPGAYGNCAAGTCGGGVAAGSCGGMGGACAGGNGGGACGGGVGGGCGGGGGGGCGGGGGGGGCGGGC